MTKAYLMSGSGIFQRRPRGLPELVAGAMFLLVASAIPVIAFIAFEQESYRAWRAGSGSLADAGSEVVTEGSVLLTESGAGSDFMVKAEKRIKARRASGKGRSAEDAMKSGGRSGIFSTVPEEGDEFPFGAGSSKPEASGPEAPWSSSVALGSYRTMCVRLCDGFYWPVSFATSRGGLADDQQTCEASCGAPVRLFYYSNPEGSPEQMVDLKGQAYASLKTAFRYRAVYDEACKCQPHPWEQASLDRHKMYAELEASGKLKAFLAKASKGRKKTRSAVSFAAFDPYDPRVTGIGTLSGRPKTRVLRPKKSGGMTVEGADFGGDGDFTGSIDGEPLPKVIKAPRGDSMRLGGKTSPRSFLASSGKSKAKKYVRRRSGGGDGAIASRK